MNPFTTAQAGKYGGFTIDGVNAAAGATGVHYGEVVAGHCDDLVSKNFNKAGSKNWWFDNRNGNWTEENVFTRCFSDNGTIDALFDVNGGATSFGYNHFLGFQLRINAGQVGLRAQNGARLYNCTHFWKGNSAGAGSIVWSILDTALLSGLFNVHFEAAAGGAPTGLNLAATATLNGEGVIDMSSNLTNVRGAGAAMLFSGWLNLPGITQVPFYSSGDTTINAVLDTPSGVNRRTRLDFQARGVGQYAFLTDRNLANVQDLALYDIVNNLSPIIVSGAGGVSNVGLNNAAPVPRAAAIASPTAPSAAYVQAEAQSMKTAVDAIRVALQNIGITL